MLTDLLTSGEMAIPAGGIAGAIAFVLVTVIKARAVQKDQQATWTNQHMDRLISERNAANERADKLQDECDEERRLRIQTEERIADLEEEILRLRAHRGQTGAVSCHDANPE